jgi:hypothetical protein
MTGEIKQRVSNEKLNYSINLIWNKYRLDELERSYPNYDKSDYRLFILNSLNSLIMNSRFYHNFNENIFCNFVEKLLPDFSKNLKSLENFDCFLSTPVSLVNFYNETTNTIDSRVVSVQMKRISKNNICNFFPHLYSRNMILEKKTPYIFCDTNFYSIDKKIYPFLLEINSNNNSQPLFHFRAASFKE